MHTPGTLYDVLDQVIVIMHKEDALMMPVKRLYRISQALFQEPVSLESFEHMLNEDHRFLVIQPNQDQTDKQKYMTEDELEAIGYDNGSRVMIRSRMPDRQEMLDMLVNKADKAFDSLKHAWDIRPENDVETEDRLLNALAKAQRLQRELRLLTRELVKSEEPIEF